MKYTVKWLEDNLGITRKALRNYEAKGLLSSEVSRNPFNNYREYDDEDIDRIWSIKILQSVGYTRDKAVMRKLDKLVADFPDTYKLIDQTDIDKTYSMPKSYVSYRKPRNISEAKREQAIQMILEIKRDCHHQNAP